METRNARTALKKHLAINLHPTEFPENHQQTNNLSNSLMFHSEKINLGLVKSLKVPHINKHMIFNQ